MAYAAETLGRFVADSRWEDMPPALRHEAKRSILNAVGCGLGVARDPAVTTALAVMRPFSGAPECTVLGQSAKLDPMAASFVNAIACNLLDYDDTHLNTVIHPTSPIAPALLALAEQRGLPGAAVLHAFLLGGEVACRVGNAVSPGHYARGWHITSTCGALGAAAGAAKLLGLTAEQTAHAIGIATSQAGGTVENLPSAAKNVSVGNAPRHGILSALLAQQGYKAAPRSIEGPLGFARAMGDVPMVEEITGGLGERWEIARNTYKPYPAGIVFHAVIDACLALRAEAPAEAIDSVTVAGDALLLARGDRAVNNERDARVSIHHSAALGFVRASAGVADFEMPAVLDPVLSAFRARVTARLEPALPRGAATVTLRLKDGRELTRTVTDPIGSEANPMSDAALEAKFRDNAAIGGVSARADEAIAGFWALDGAGSVGRLMESCG
ncbi:MmgE/PrpD family protein [Rhodovarius crocodyli]|uniref:MmgE/PrpD family protein n=1 Tax=Rhodovarius crocodyli TaxID=1979269 RepID=A0A437MDN9_9PROT|nr:MmgE/PrpD family protein [Rhodovarius crocodyli]RVT95762.1 MmgE/PrpD family protein [Rhodovarius crocodyli]